MSYLEKTGEVLRDVLAMADREGKKTGFCIGNTSKVDAHGLYFSPIRNTRQVVAGSVIVYQAHQAAGIAEAVDGKVKYIFVDTEKKVGPDPEHYGPEDRGNIERAVRDVVSRSTILTYKGNDLTVDSIECLLAQFIPDPVRGIGGKRVAIIGAGNLGSKLALKLVERGAHVILTRRNREKLDTIVKALNLIKAGQTVATVEGTTDNEEAADGAHIVIGLANGRPVITRSMVERVTDDAILMDAGKGCLYPEAVRMAEKRNLVVLRVDIRAGFEGQVAMLLEMERLLNHGVGRREIMGIPIVSGGLLGRRDEIVVDNVFRPTAIYGVADGQGDFIRTLSGEQARRMVDLRNTIRESAIQNTSDR